MNILHPLLLLLALVSGAAQAADAASVLSVNGASTVQRTGSAARILGAGDTLTARDVISVGADSYTMLEFSDQTRVTLRPGTVFRIDAYSEGTTESMILGLVKGGLRAVTGLFSKRNRDAVKITTATATIGIRGTEFDARLCEGDCAAEVDPSPPGTEPNAIDAGLYVWVRDGAVQLSNGAQAVDVPAGSAAVVKGEQFALLDEVPKFMRLDSTPRPMPGGAEYVLPPFVLKDGTIIGSCKP